MDKEGLLQLIQLIKESTKAIMNKEEVGSNVVENESAIQE